MGQGDIVQCHIRYNGSATNIFAEILYIKK